MIVRNVSLAAMLALVLLACSGADSRGGTSVQTGSTAGAATTLSPSAGTSVDQLVTAESGALAPLPDNTWLNFLAELCGDVCFRDAHWMEPTNLTVGTGVWTAYRPFHVREGFVAKGDAALGEGFDVALTITRRAGPPLDTGVFPIDETFVDSTDFVTRGTSEYCGPGYASQDGPQECEWFVHDFPDGLPPGRYDIRADWQAPCSAWVELGFVETCTDPDEVMSLFNSFVNSPFEDDPSYDTLQELGPVFIGEAGVDQTSEQFEPGGVGFGPTTTPLSGCRGPESTEWAQSAIGCNGSLGGNTYTCPPGGQAYTVWGTNIYTHDSSVCTAAVHAGLIDFEDGGEVIIEMRPGESSYLGTTANGVTTMGYGSWGRSFVFVDG